jgi:pimeloyl-ACP methyl ester carboxylesterase
MEQIIQEEQRVAAAGVTSMKINGTSWPEEVKTRKAQVINGKDTFTVSRLFWEPVALAIALLWFGAGTVLANSSQAGRTYSFPLVDQLTDNPMMPDPFKKPDGTRVATLAEWPQQRAYLRAMLEHYLYGHVPPRPTEKELSFKRTSDEAYTPPDSTIGGRKQGYRITISRNGLEHSFTFNLWRRAELKRYPTLINNYPEHSPANPGFSMAEGLRRGYMVVEFERTEVAPDRADNANRKQSIFPLYPEYDFYTIAAWAWAYQPVIDVLDRLGVVDMERIIVTGHSRGGQAAMAAGIFDERIAIVAPSTGGPWSVGSFRQRDPKGYRGTMDYAEMIQMQFPHWYHTRFAEFTKRQNKLPWDAATLVALTAPRPLLNVNAVDDGVNNGLAHEAGIRAGMLIYGWMGAEKWCRLHWRDKTNQYGQKGHDEGPEEFSAIYDYADEFLFSKPRGSSTFNVAPKSDTWRYDPAKFPLLIDWTVPTSRAPRLPISTQKKPSAITSPSTDFSQYNKKFPAKLSKVSLANQSAKKASENQDESKVPPYTLPEMFTLTMQTHCSRKNSTKMNLPVYPNAVVAVRPDCRATAAKYEPRC